MNRGMRNKERSKGRERGIEEEEKVVPTET